MFEDGARSRDPVAGERPRRPCLVRPGTVAALQQRAARASNGPERAGGRGVSAAASHLRAALRVGAEVAPWHRAAAAALADLALPPVLWIGRRSGPPCPGATPWLDEAEDDLAPRLAALGVDLLLDLTFRPLRRDLGIGETWQIRFGEEGRPGLPGGPELVEGERSVLARLIALDAPDRGRVLLEGRIKTVRHSLAATRARVLEVVARWPARALAWRRAGLLPVGVGTPCRLRPEPPAEPRGLALRQLVGALRRLAECAVDERWRVGVLETSIGELLGGARPPVRWLAEHAEGWLADPVGVRGPLVLAEAFDPATGRGHLVRTELRAGAAVVPVLRASHHLSWPFLVEDAGEVFLLPEASATGRIQLFRGAPFPDRFEPDAVLVDGFAGVDPTVVRHAGHWYLFATDRADQDETRLHLFVADALRGPWRRHPMSPVVDDLASARPAGPLFTYEGSLFRPAQDCSRTYGGGVVINRIEALSPELFREVPVARLDPDPTGPCPDGLHTLTVTDGAILIDGKRERRSLRAFLRNAWALRDERRAARARGRQAGGSLARESPR
jgi:hypothetical protein